MQSLACIEPELVGCLEIVDLHGERTFDFGPVDLMQKTGLGDALVGASNESDARAIDASQIGAARHRLGGDAGV